MNLSFACFKSLLPGFITIQVRVLLAIASSQHFCFFFDSVDFACSYRIQNNIDYWNDRNWQKNVNALENFFIFYPTSFLTKLRPIVVICWINQENYQNYQRRSSNRINTKQEKPFIFFICIFHVRSDKNWEKFSDYFDSLNY